MKIPRFSLREQRLAFVTGVAILTGVVVSKGLAPGWQRWQDLRDQAGMSLQKLQRLQGLVEQQPAVEAAYQQHADLLSADEAEPAQRRFLDDLDLLAQGQLRLDLKPRPAQTADGLTRLSIEIDAQGTQEAILAFLDQLLTSPAPVELERLRIFSSSSLEAPLRANLVVTKVLVPPAS